jgi:Cu+-exporting ATPase
MAAKTTIELPIMGMTCASCVARNEKFLTRTPGVESAAVNLATESARVTFDASQVSIAELVQAVRGGGYDVNTASVTLPIGGMTCASCVARVERAVRKVPGVVEVSVNLATEQAKVDYVPGVAGRESIVAAVRGAGYGVPGTAPLGSAGDATEAGTTPKTGGAVAAAASGATAAWASAAAAEELEAAQAKARAASYLSLKRKVTLGAMPPSSSWAAWFPFLPSFLHNGYVLWALATPVQFWVGRQFYRGAWAALRHGTTRHEHADRHGLQRRLLLQRRSASSSPASSPITASAMPMYFDSAALIITLILFGRLLEARAKGQTGPAIKALIGLQPKTARVLRDGVRPTCPSPRSSPATSSSCAPARRCRSTASSSTAAPPSTSPCSPASRSRWPSGSATR